MAIKKKQMYTPKVSIITISKDDPDGLAKTLASINSQTFKDYEHILVLAGRSLELKLPVNNRQKILIDVESGISNALNAGVCATKGEWVQFLNGGDFFSEPDSLHYMISAGVSDVEMVCAFAKVLQRSFTIPRRNLRPGRDNFIYASHQASLYRRRLFTKFGLFSKEIRIHMDLEWLTRLPKNLPYVFLDLEAIHFDSNGVSSTNVFASSIEEFYILIKTQRFKHLALTIIFLKLPFRLIRREYHRFSKYLII